MTRHTGTLERTFEYYKPNGDVGEVMFNIEFSYSPGTRHSHPGGHWNRWSGSWDPPDDPAWEIGEVTRRAPDGKYVLVTEADWFWEAWVVPLWDSLEAVDFREALVL